MLMLFLVELSVHHCLWFQDILSCGVWDYYIAYTYLKDSMGYVVKFLLIDLMISLTIY